MSVDIGRVVAPVMTPIADDGGHMVDRIPEVVEYTLDCGCDAVIASGTGVQDIHTLSTEERMAEIEQVTEVVNGRVPVIAGVSHPAMVEVDRLIDHAEAIGAEAVMGTPPWGPTVTQDHIFEYFARIANRSALPVFVYNNPGLTTGMDRETLRRVADLDEVDWIKESGHDWKKIAWLVDRLQEAGRADVFATMEVFLPLLDAGGTGVVSPAPTTVPCNELLAAYESTDRETAVTLQRELSRFPPVGASAGGAAIWKAVSTADGVDVGEPRDPHDPVTETDLELLREWLGRVDIRSP